MELPRLQYITHPEEQFEDLSWVHRLHEGGVRWIQLRMKETDVVRSYPGKHYRALFHETADKLRAITGALGMLLTINDAADVALFAQADGLHIGQEDELPEQAFSGLPDEAVRGGTANTFEEMLRYKGAKMSYFGVGPFRHTDTKAALKPFLGTEGYKKLLDRMASEGMTIPVYAIGGITSADVRSLLDAGVYGVAVSGAVFHTGHDIAAVRSFIQQIEEYELAIGG